MHSEKQRLFILLCGLVCISLILAGCAPAISPPQQPGIHTLNTTVHCTIIPNNGGIERREFDAELNFSVNVVESEKDEVSFSMTTPDDWKYDFMQPNRVFYSLHEDENLPYFCFSTRYQQTTTHIDFPFVMAVDTEAGYFVAKINANYTEWYLVASVDEDVDPNDILDHFSAFLDLYRTEDEQR